MPTFLITIESHDPPQAVSTPFDADSDRHAVRGGKAYVAAIRSAFKGDVTRFMVDTLSIGRFNHATGLIETTSDVRLFDSADEDVEFRKLVAAFHLPKGDLDPPAVDPPIVAPGHSHAHTLQPGARSGPL